MSNRTLCNSPSAGALTALVLSVLTLFGAAPVAFGQTVPYLPGPAPNAGTRTAFNWLPYRAPLPLDHVWPTYRPAPLVVAPPTRPRTPVVLNRPRPSVPLPPAPGTERPGRLSRQGLIDAVVVVFPRVIGPMLSSFERHVSQATSRLTSLRMQGVEGSDMQAALTRALADLQGEFHTRSQVTFERIRFESTSRLLAAGGTQADIDLVNRVAEDHQRQLRAANSAAQQRLRDAAGLP